MNSTQYNRVLRALVDFAENTSASTAENLQYEVFEVTRRLANPKFRWTFKEDKDVYKLYNRNNVLLAIVLQPENSHEWLIYFPESMRARKAGSGRSFIETQTWVEAQF
jgi:hypothetical protein